MRPARKRLHMGTYFRHCLGCRHAIQSWDALQQCGASLRIDALPTLLPLQTGPTSHGPHVVPVHVNSRALLPRCGNHAPSFARGGRSY